LFTTVQSIEPRINACSESQSQGLFLTCRGENVYFYAQYDTQNIIAGVVSINIEYNDKSSTWNGGSLYKAANLYLCWPHAQSKLPHF
jgi:hypothetical protein